jgi:hypothetical protein
MPESESRRRLRELVEKRATLQRDLDAIAARRLKLQAHASVVSPSEAALAALESREISQMSEWSRNPEGDPPKPDVAGREKLRRDAEAARISAASARKALESLETEEHRASEPMGAIQRSIYVLSHEIAFDEIATPLVHEIAATEKHLATLLGRLDVAHGHIVTVAHSRLGDEGDKRTLFAANARAVKLRMDTGRPPADDASGWHAAFTGHIDALQGDASVVFDSVEAAKPIDEAERFRVAGAAYNKFHGIIEREAA